MTKDNPEIWLGLPEDLGTAIDEGSLQKPGMVAMSIGERGFLTRQTAKRMGIQWQEFVRRCPDGMFSFSISGYDDDPRELWDIAEVVHYVKQWAHFAGMDNLETANRLVGPASPVGRSMPQMKGLSFLMACGVFGSRLEAVARGD